MLCLHGLGIKERGLECFVHVVLCYPIGHLAHYPRELQGVEVAVFEHCDLLCLVELVFLELKDDKVLSVGDYPPTGFFTFLDCVFHISSVLM